MMMDHVKARKILETLASGVDPATGQSLPDSSPYNNTETVRALFLAARQLQFVPDKAKKTTEERRQENLRNGRPGNAGLPWDVEARAYAASSFQKGATVDLIATDLDRTKGSIIAELQRQGLISEEAAKSL